MAKAGKGALAVGDRAPDFTMPADGGGMIKSADFKGKPVILYFYPKDDTSGCTKEACGFNDALTAFGKSKTTVIGVSRDSVASHDKFKKKYGLKFQLGSDHEGKVSEAYGAWVEKSLYGRKYMGLERSTFLIDGKGVIRAIWRKVKVLGHVDEVLAAAKGLDG